EAQLVGAGEVIQRCPEVLALGQSEFFSKARHRVGPELHAAPPWQGAERSLRAHDAIIMGAEGTGKKATVIPVARRTTRPRVVQQQQRRGRQPLPPANGGRHSPRKPMRLFESWSGHG